MPARRDLRALVLPVLRRVLLRYTYPTCARAGDPVIIPAVFAIARGLPVIVTSYILLQGEGNVQKLSRKSVLLKFGYED